MSKTVDEEGKVLYEHNCPIAKNSQWPPVGSEEDHPNIWDSLTACPYKLAAHHGFSYEAVAGAVDRWINNGSGLLATNEERDSFAKEVQLICEEERTFWTFKRTPILLDIGGYEEWEIDHEEQGGRRC